MPPLTHMSRRPDADDAGDGPTDPAVERADPTVTTSTGAGAPDAPEGRGVVLLRNASTEEREAAIVLDGPETVVRHARLAPGEVAVVGSPVAGGPVTAEVHADTASASFSFDPDEAPVPPLFTLRDGGVLVASE